MFFVSEDGIGTESTPELATYCFEYRTPDLPAESWSGGSEKAESNWSGAGEDYPQPHQRVWRPLESAADVLRTALGRFRRHDSLPVSARRVVALRCLACSALALKEARVFAP